MTWASVCGDRSFSDELRPRPDFQRSPQKRPDDKMRTWPTLKRVLLVWGIGTALACVAFVLYAQTLPRDELVVANTLSFQAMMSVIVVAIPSGIGLLCFLLVGALVKGWATRHKRKTE